MPLKISALSAVLTFYVVAAYGAQCNQRSGFIPEQPASPVAEEAAVATEPNEAATEQHSAFDNQTLILDLGKDLDSLIGMSGRLSRGVGVLGVRLENIPNYNSSKHCNRVTMRVYKPRIDRLANGRLQASVDDRRFKVEFDRSVPARPWTMDSDASGRFIWIFPASFGGGIRKPWSLAKSYDTAYRKTENTEQKRWIAEAWINLALRTYRNRELVEQYPKGRRPTRADLNASFRREANLNCTEASRDLACLATRLIEENEAAPPGDSLAREAFHTGDALYLNSGVSTGLRQLDFGTSNEQASSLVTQLMPTTLGKMKPKTGYRTPVRRWDVDQLNHWYAVVGQKANEELSRDEAKHLLLASHAQYIAANTKNWERRLFAAYPQWNDEERIALGITAIDLENVTGYSLRLPRGAKTICEVLTDSAQETDTNKRTNRSVSASQLKRMNNGSQLIRASFPSIDYRWPC